MASESLTSVQSLETNVFVPEQTTEELEVHQATDPACLFRHAGWAPQRARIRQALEITRVRPRRLLDFDLCGCGAWLMVDKADDSRHVVCVRTCRNRWCVPCTRTRSFVMAQNLHRRLSQTTSRKIELTLRSVDLPLQRQIDRLWDCFKVLRKTELWTSNVGGGAAVFEVTRNRLTGLWHPHLHIVYAGNWIEKRDLAAEWKRITGDSYIVHIRLVGNSQQAAHYVTKYVLKPCPPATAMPIEALAELITAFHGRRLVTTFGNWRGFRLTAKLGNTEWQSLGTLDHILCLVRGGRFDPPHVNGGRSAKLAWRLRQLSTNARHLLRAVCRGSPSD